jgi:hypothetical protein
MFVYEEIYIYIYIFIHKHNFRLTMNPKIGLGIHSIPPATIATTKSQDLNPCYKCDIKAVHPPPPKKNLVQAELNAVLRGKQSVTSPT